MDILVFLALLINRKKTASPVLTNDRFFLALRDYLNLKINKGFTDLTSKLKTCINRNQDSKKRPATIPKIDCLDILN